MANIQMQSVQSLRLEPMFDGAKLSSATGFIVFSGDIPILITNRHVVTGRHQDTKECLSETCAIPNKLAIFHNKKMNLVSGLNLLSHWSMNMKINYGTNIRL